MKLYHFTCISYIQQIIQQGICKGEIPLTHNRCLNAVNLTTDKLGKGHGLSTGQFYSPEQVRLMGHRVGQNDVVPYFPDKTKIRIAVEVEKARLNRWLRWSKRHILDERFRQAMIKTGGGIDKARTWYFCDGVIGPEDFVAIDIWNDDSWMPLETYTGDYAETYTDKTLLEGFGHWGAQLRIGRSQRFLDQLNDAILSVLDVPIELCAA